MIETQKVITGYSDYLAAEDWDFFATCTTRYPITLKSTRRLADKLAKVSKAHNMFWAAEPFQVRDGFHFHALIKTDVEQQKLWKYWSKYYGRAQFSKYEPMIGAEGYCAKYINKYLSDYDFLIPKQKLLNLKP